MKTKSLGVQRLSLAAGLAAALYALYDTDLMKVLSVRPVWWSGLGLILIGCAIWFLIGWLAIRLPAWIILGFMEDRRNRPPDGR